MRHAAERKEKGKKDDPSLDANHARSAIRPDVLSRLASRWIIPDANNMKKCLFYICQSNNKLKNLDFEKDKIRALSTVASINSTWYFFEKKQWRFYHLSAQKIYYVENILSQSIATSCQMEKKNYSDVDISIQLCWVIQLGFF